MTGHRPCPHCGSQRPEKETVCAFCGNEIPAIYVPTKDDTQCVKCGEFSHIALPACPMCDTPKASPRPRQQVSPSLQSDTSTLPAYCPNCKTVYLPRATACESCGRARVAESELETPQESKPATKQKVSFYQVLGVAVCLASPFLYCVRAANRNLAEASAKRTAKAEAHLTITRLLSNNNGSAVLPFNPDFPKVEIVVSPDTSDRVAEEIALEARKALQRLDAQMPVKVVTPAGQVIVERSGFFEP